MKDTKEEQASVISPQRGGRSVGLEEAPQLQRPSIARVLVIICTQRASVCGSNWSPWALPCLLCPRKVTASPRWKEILANYTLSGLESIFLKVPK